MAKEMKSSSERILKWGYSTDEDFPLDPPRTTTVKITSCSKTWLSNVSSEKRGIHKGDQFLCIKDVIMNGEENEIAYFQGEIYLSENDGCITDEYGDKSHWWIKEEEINSYFKKIQP